MLLRRKQRPNKATTPCRRRARAEREPASQLSFCVHCGEMIIMYFLCGPSIFYAWPAGLAYSTTQPRRERSLAGNCAVTRAVPCLEQKLRARRLTKVKRLMRKITFLGDFFFSPKWSKPADWWPSLPTALPAEKNSIPERRRQIQ